MHQLRPLCLSASSCGLEIMAKIQKEVPERAAKGVATVRCAGGRFFDASFMEYGDLGAKIDL
jgi:hypothetical protein